MYLQMHSYVEIGLISILLSAQVFVSIEMARNTLNTLIPCDVLLSMTTLLLFCPGHSCSFLSQFVFFYFNSVPLRSLVLSIYPSLSLHPGEQWLSNNLCRKPLNLKIEHCELESNVKGQFSIFPLVRLRFANTPGLAIRHIHYTSHAAYDLAPVELPLTWVIWKCIKI